MVGVRSDKGIPSCLRRSIQGARKQLHAVQDTRRCKDAEDGLVSFPQRASCGKHSLCPLPSTFRHHLMRVISQLSQDRGVLEEAARQGGDRIVCQFPGQRVRFANKASETDARWSIYTATLEWGTIQHISVSQKVLVSERYNGLVQPYKMYSIAFRLLLGSSSTEL